MLINTHTSLRYQSHLLYRLSLVLTLTVQENAGQVFCRLFLSWDLSDVLALLFLSHGDWLPHPWLEQPSLSLRPCRKSLQASLWSVVRPENPGAEQSFIDRPGSHFWPPRPLFWGDFLHCTPVPAAATPSHVNFLLYRSTYRQSFLLFCETSAATGC